MTGDKTNINEDRKKVKESFRMECIGAGMYKSLAKQYDKDEALSGTLLEFSNQEAMHGRLFNAYYRKNFRKDAGWRYFWFFIGMILAQAMRFLSNEKKFQKIAFVETQAVKNINKMLMSGEESDILKILKRILPDEMKHARLYSEVFNK